MSLYMPEKPTFSSNFLKYLLITTAILTILLFSNGIDMVEYGLETYFQLLGLVDGIPLAIYLCFLVPQYRRYILAKTNYKKYEQEEAERLKRKYEYSLRAQEDERKRKEQIENERQMAILSQQNTSPWAVKYSTHPCPHCGHYKVRCAKWEDKKASVAFWGIHSSKLAANYKCEQCGEMWE